jgi:uncharacterized protein YqeY
MTLEDRIKKDLITAMKAKDKIALRGIRAIKAAILLANTDGSGEKMTEEKEIKLLQKLVKQRRDSVEIFEKEDRNDLAQTEKEEIAIIEKYLPEQLSPEKLEDELKKIMASVGATSMKDMGKIMGAATKQLAGRADGKSISSKIKELLNS